MKRTPIVKYGMIEFDDGEEKDIELHFCEKYSGTIPPEGLYFTEGDQVTIQSEEGPKYDQEGVVVAIEGWCDKEYMIIENRRRKRVYGKFGMYTVQIVSGENEGQVVKMVKSEEMRRRKLHTDVPAVHQTLGVIQVAPVDVAPVVGGGGGGGGTFNDRGGVQPEGNFTQVRRGGGHNPNNHGGGGGSSTIDTHRFY